MFMCKSFLFFNPFSILNLFESERVIFVIPIMHITFYFYIKIGLIFFLLYKVFYQTEWQQKAGKNILRVFLRILFPLLHFFMMRTFSPIHDIRITHTTYNTRDFLCGESVMHEGEKNLETSEKRRKKIVWCVLREVKLLA